MDLKAPLARPVFEKLVGNSDVFMTNLSVPAVESLRMTYNDLSAINPRLIYIAMPGFGAGPGPYREYRSWGPNLSSLSGLDYLTGDADRDPVMTPLPLPDYVGAYHAVTAILAALLERQTSGTGCEIRMAQFETTVNVLGPQVIEAQLTGVVPGRRGNRNPIAVPRDLFPSAGHDRWVSIEIFSDEDWRRLAAVEGMPAALRNERFASAAARAEHEEELYGLIGEWTSARTNREAADFLQAAGVAGNSVATNWDHLTDPQLEARRFWKAVCHDRLGLDLTSSLAFQMSETAPRYHHAMASFGHDSEDVIRRVAGLSHAEADAVISAKAVEREAQIPNELAGVRLERPSGTWAWPLLRLTPPVLTDDDAPAAAADPVTPKRLADLLVLDMSDEISAYGTYLLARLGCTVVRIEPPGGAAIRGVPPLDDGISSYEMFMDGLKSSLIIDFDSARGQAAFRDLLRRADVLFVGDDHAALHRAGLGWTEMHALNPALSLVSVKPFGQTGPYRHRRAGELGLWALSGMMPITGYPDRRPMLPGGALAANLVGATAAFATLAALNARIETGRGQNVDVSAHEVMVFTCSGMLGQIEDGAERQRTGVRALGAAPYGFFRCADRQISLLALFPNHWESLAAWIAEKTGNERAVDQKYKGSSMVRFRYVEEVEALVNSLTGMYGANEFCREAQERGVPAMPVNSVAELLEDPHLEATAFWEAVTLSDGKEIRWPGPPFRMDGMPRAAPPPRVGEGSTDRLRSAVLQQ
jgi:benzylsuccinate CoA-transferase BbsF subunit